ASGWLGNPGATENQIVSLESRLGKKLPPSYRAFLKTSNGFRTPGINISRLQPIEKVEWFRVRNQETIDIWRSNGLENLSATLCISAIDFWGGTYFLLNPKVVTSDGEWEALYFDPGKAACEHFPSFWELMQDERRGFLIVEEMQAQHMQPDDDLHTVVVKLPNLIKKLEEQEKNPLTRIPNQEMEEAITEYIIRGRRQNADSQSSKKKENANEPASPDKSQITGTRKEVTYEGSTYNVLITVSGDPQKQPNNRNLEAAYQRYLEYEDGARESLRSAKLRLLEIQTKSNRPEVVSRELVSLKKELNEKYQGYAKNNPWVHNYRSNLHNRETGFMEGCSIAAGLIIEFLNEPVAVTWDALKTRIMESVAPKYSSAQSASASVVMIINVHGVVTRAYQSEGDEELGNAVAQALKKWRFHPDLTKDRGFDVSCEISARLVAGELEFGNGSSGNSRSFPTHP
ncbi:MAG: SMI1/KNR4 family protein, partial [Blastocatellia bacterium]